MLELTLCLLLFMFEVRGLRVFYFCYRLLYLRLKFQLVLLADARPCAGGGVGSNFLFGGALALEEGVVKDLSHTGPLLGIDPQYLLDEVDFVLLEAVGEDDVLLLHLVVDVDAAFAPEGRRALDELEQQDAQGPDVHFVVVGLLQDHLGGHVLASPAEGAAVLEDGREAEVAQLGVVVLGEQDVLGLG